MKKFSEFRMDLAEDGIMKSTLRAPLNVAGKALKGVASGSETGAQIGALVPVPGASLAGGVAGGIVGGAMGAAAGAVQSASDIAGNILNTGSNAMKPKKPQGQPN